MIPLLFTLAMLFAEMPEHLADDLSTVHTQLATLGSRLEAMQAAVTKAEAATARQGERMYELIRDNDRLQTERMMLLKERLDRSEGKSSGISQGWGVLIGLLSTGIAIAALLSTRRRTA